MIDHLRCPITGQPLAFAEVGPDWVAVPRKGAAPPPIWRGPRAVAGPLAERTTLLVTQDESLAYPVVDGIPVLLGPERLVPVSVADDHEPVDLSTPQYAEAYEEMAHYNNPANRFSYDVIMGALAKHRDQVPSAAPTFPHPAHLWIDAPHDSLAQLDAYAHLAPVADKQALQIGGSGSHAVKMLLAGARSATLVTPMLYECQYARGLAVEWGVQDNFFAVVGIGEELPLADGSIDLAYSGGCFHHMRFDHLGGQLHRVLASRGRFAGVDPYATLLHALGTRLLGKREASVHCRPVTSQRLAKIRRIFPEASTQHHGPVLRYLFLGLDKLTGSRLVPSVPAMMNVMRVDNFIGRVAAPLGFRGGSVTISGVKAQTSPRPQVAHA